MNRTSVLFLVGILFICATITQTYALDTSKDATPIVNVTFQESATLTNMTLNQSGTKVPAIVASSPMGAAMSISTGLLMNFFIRPVDLVENGIFNLTIEAADANGNKQKWRYDFLVDYPGQNITIETPRNGGTMNLTTNLTIVSENPSECRWAAGTTLIRDGKTFLTMKKFQSDDQGDLRHRFKDFLGPLGLNVQLQYGQSAPFTVTCNDSTLLSARRFSITYLGTAPRITVTNNPDPIIDPENPVTTISVVADQDIWCTMDGKEAFGVQWYANFKSPQQTTYTDTPEPDETNRTAVIYCENRVGLNTTVNYTIDVRYDDPVSINFTSLPTVASNTYTLKFTTNKLARCSAKANGNAMVLTSDGKTIDNTVLAANFASLSMTLGNGSTTFIVTCQSGLGEPVTQNYDVYVDTKKPVINSIDTDARSCSFNKLVFHFNASDDAAKPNEMTYQYTLANDTAVMIPATNSTNSEVTIGNLKLVNGSTYTFSGVVYDRAGNPSTKVDQKITASDPRGQSCDKTPPEAAIYQIKWSAGTNATLVCTDRQSGCQDTYHYDITPINKTCTVNTTGKTAQIAQIFLVTQDSWMCYSVKDKAGNAATGVQHIYVNSSTRGSLPVPGDNKTPTGTCADGIKNRDETGIDCGGYNCGIVLKKLCAGNTPCQLDADCASGVCSLSVCAPASCTNGIQDSGESDVDCGGSCRPCESGSHCTTSTDCVAGTRCQDNYCGTLADTESPASDPIDNTTDEGTGTKPSLAKFLLLILGTLCTIGGSAYSILFEPKGGPRPGSYSPGNFSGNQTGPIARLGDDDVQGSGESKQGSETARKDTVAARNRRKASVERRRTERSGIVEEFEDAKDLTKMEHVTHKEIEHAFKEFDTKDVHSTLKKLVADDKLDTKDIAIALKDLEAGGHLDTDAIEDLKKSFNIKQ